mmetsp:Transcript_9519/g.16750  ORF Transcript_9519/g.16750 Transcript_9519/m.16750 type:complete len:205 (+) Transcript_9519:498-1112(+)
MTSLTVTLSPFQSRVAALMSSPTFLGERPRGPTLGARAEAAPISPPMARMVTILMSSAGGGPIVSRSLSYFAQVSKLKKERKDFCRLLCRSLSSPALLLPTYPPLYPSLSLYAPAYPRLEGYSKHTAGAASPPIQSSLHAASLLPPKLRRSVPPKCVRPNPVIFLRFCTVPLYGIALAMRSRGNGTGRSPEVMTSRLEFMANGQ